MPKRVWDVENVIGRELWAFTLPVGRILLVQQLLIDHFELFGLKQVWRRDEASPRGGGGGARLATIAIPLGAPSVDAGICRRLLGGADDDAWAGCCSRLRTTLWILIAIQIEERDLAQFLGEPYRDYQERTPMLVPFTRRGKLHSAENRLDQ